MDQAVNASIPPASNGQSPGGNTLTIAALAERWAQLSEASTSDRTLNVQTAIQDVILATEPVTCDEALTLARVVTDELHAVGAEQLADTMEAVCRALQRAGVKDLLCKH